MPSRRSARSLSSAGSTRPTKISPGAERVVVISHEFWQARLGGRSDVLGMSLTMNQQPRTVIGVMPPGFTIEGLPGAYMIPYGWTVEQLRNAQGRGSSHGIARLRDGVSFEQAYSEMRAHHVAARKGGAAAQHQLVDHAGADSRADRRSDSARPVRPRRRRAARPADRLRQCRQPAARAQHGAATRAGPSHGARRRARTIAAPDADGKRVAVAGRRHCRALAGRRVPSRPAHARGQSHSGAAARSGRARYAGGALHAGAVTDDRLDLRHRPGGVCHRQRERRVAGRRTSRQWTARASRARHAGGGGSRLVAGAARRRRLVDSQLHRLAERRSRHAHRGRAHRARGVVGPALRHRPEAGRLLHRRAVANRRHPRCGERRGRQLPADAGPRHRHELLSPRSSRFPNLAQMAGHRREAGDAKLLQDDGDSADVRDATSAPRIPSTRRRSPSSARRSCGSSIPNEDPIGKRLAISHRPPARPVRSGDRRRGRRHHDGDARRQRSTPPSTCRTPSCRSA